MSLVEKEITQKNVESMLQNPEFQKRREREATYVAPTTEFLDAFKPQAMPFEVTVLSHPEEEFTLRVRAERTPEGTKYTGALKDRGFMNGNALDRLEVSTEISKEAYERYAQDQQFPDVKYLRAEPLPGLAIDFIEGQEYPQVEYESLANKEAPLFVSHLTSQLVDMSNSPAVRKETIAHALRNNEALTPSHETIEDFAKRVMHDMVASYVSGRGQAVVGISGMSGSGKSTAVEAVQEQLVSTFGEEMRPIILSSDDYHRGKKWLEATYGAPWTNWDDPRVYNTEELAEDIEKLSQGEAIYKKHFDFQTEEVVFDEKVQPRPFIIVEGLFAGSPDLKQVRQLHYEVPTGIATSIGRDVRRLVLENRQNGSIATPEARLRYQLETALPTYLDQERPKRNVFSSSVRPMAQRAFMLEKLQQD